MCKDGFKFVNSDYQNYYLDCGGPNSCLASTYWCPYNTWQDIYTPTIANVPEGCENSVLGGEVAMWTEIIS